MKTVERRPSGYRTYPPQAMRVLDLIATAQNAGFSLDEIRTLLPPDLEQWRHGPLMGTLRGKVADIEALQARLAHSKAQLVSLIEEIEAKPGDIDCAANARLVLSRLLDGERTADLGSQRCQAARQGVSPSTRAWPLGRQHTLPPALGAGVSERTSRRIEDSLAASNDTRPEEY